MKEGNMVRRNADWAWLGAAWLCAGASAAAGQATFHGLGFLPGTLNPQSAATAISPSGQFIVGNARLNESSALFRWSTEAGLQASLPSCNCLVMPTDASEDGSLVAGYLVSSGEGPFVWTAATGYRSIIAPFNDGRITAASADGAVLVGYGYSPIASQAFYFDGQVRQFLNPELNFTTARAITADGQTIVGEIDGRGYRFSFGRGLSYLPELPGGFFPTVNAVSDDGRVVVGGYYTPEGLVPVRWEEGELLILPGPTPAVATAVSADGLRIIGTFGPAPGIPMLWDINASAPGGEVGVPLHEALVAAGALIPSGWSLRSASAISADGTILAGQGRDPAGLPQAWRASLPRFSVGCYANCDGSTGMPLLNVADFACFLQRFNANEPYANCDGSTVEPILNAADFSCFLQHFAAGCS